MIGKSVRDSVERYVFFHHGRPDWPALGRPATAHDIGVVFQSPSLIQALDVVENSSDGP
ncbi:hypothetical protein [Streptomyces sp. 11-1-2]|uniref:hypothetical protein n=1 Tax=unclassified Streptomyces TaxID=2593676 RepID=UPI001969296A|nr:hypothetical protein [Streptomyces sp. 11-1-2]